MNQHPKDHPGGRYSLALGLGVFLTICLVGFLTWSTWRDHRQVQDTVEKQNRLLIFGVRISRLAQEAGLDAALAASTGDARWRESHLRTSRDLQGTIDEALGLAPPELKEHLLLVKESAASAAEIESMALEAAGEGGLDRAADILDSPIYKDHREEFLASLNGVFRAGGTWTMDQANRMVEEHWTGNLIAVTVIFLLVILWAVLITRLHRGFRSLHDARVELERDKNDLSRQVEERTGLLRETNLSLQAEVRQRRLAEEAARTSEENYRATFDSSNDAIFVLDSSTGRILEVNRRTEEMYGYGQGELLNLAAGELGAAEAGYGRQAAEAMMDAARRGKPQVFEWLARKKDGSLFWVEVSLTRAHLLGRQTLLGTVRDITGRKIAEDRLRSREEVLRLFARHAPAAVAMFDRDMRYLMYSKRWLEDYRLPDDDLTGRGHYEVFPELSDEVRAVHARCLAGATEKSEEDIFRRADGSLEWLRWEVHPWRDENGEIGGIVIFTELLTQGKKAADQLELARNFFENAVEGVMVTDHEGRIRMVNRAFTIITGYSSEEAVGRTPRLLRSNRHGKEFYAKLWESLKRHGEWRGEIWNRRKNGEAFLEWQTILAVRGESPDRPRYLSIFHDITDMRNSEEQIEYQANYDALTGLPNRSLFMDRLKVAMDQAEREKRRLAVISLDIDNFKNLNDSLGHAQGDLVLQQAAARLENMGAGEITVARFGGDEFYLMPTELQGGREAVSVAHAALAALSHPFQVESGELFLTASMGIAVFPGDGADPQTLVKNADTALHQAKQRGKNTYQLFEPELNAQVSERLMLENNLRRALEREEFVLFYQPKVDLASSSMAGAEALIRWRDSKGGLVPPLKFIPLAEETGLIVPMGEWVLYTACRQAAKWRAQGWKDFRVAVNLSARQLREVDVVALVKRTLKETGLPPGGLELEITESMIMQDMEAAIGTMVVLSELGVAVTMDDFGTGYSSLSYLKRLPLRAIKIDKSFVTGLPGDSDDAALVNTIVTMAKNLRLKVIAEGVETREQLEFLREQGCHQIQGYYFSRPVPAAEFGELLRSGRVLD